MEFSVILFVLAVSIVHISAQDEPALAVNFKDSTDRHVELGSELDLDFVVNRSPIYGMTNAVYMLRQRMQDGKLVTDQLSDTAKLKDGDPTYYEVDFDTSEKQLTIHFKIKEVRDIDDATYICKVIDDATKEMTNSSLKVIVLRGNTKLHLKVGDFDAIDTSMSTPFEVDSGHYPVVCTSEGSNPATEDIQIVWNGESVSTSQPTVEQMSGDLTKYRTIVSGTIDVTLGKSGETVECLAKSKAGEQLSTKAPIKVNVYDPNVTCTSNVAFVGQRYPVLSCEVDETGHEIASYAFEHGTTGVVIRSGTQSDEFDEVNQEDLGNSRTKVNLKLHNVKDSHFSKYYLVITQTNGHETREAVVLEEVEGPKDNSNMLGASLTTFALCVLCALWKTL